jgi:hypothetical protein
MSILEQYMFDKSKHDFIEQIKQKEKIKKRQQIRPVSQQET